MIYDRGPPIPISPLTAVSPSLLQLSKATTELQRGTSYSFIERDITHRKLTVELTVCDFMKWVVVTFLIEHSFYLYLTPLMVNVRKLYPDCDI